MKFAHILGARRGRVEGQSRGSADGFSRRWLTIAVVACALATACQDWNTNLTVQTNSSTLTYVSPSTATAGTNQPLTITAVGSGFVSGAYIVWNPGGANATNLTTTFVSASQLTAPVPTSLLATAGTAQIAVEIPGSAVSPTSNIYSTQTTELSNVIPFTVTPLSGGGLQITSLSAPPNSLPSAPYCQPNGFTLTVNGSGFASNAVVYWNGSSRQTTDVSANQLTAAISATDAAFPGKATVTVNNPSGSAPSNQVFFTLVTPTSGSPSPVVSSIAPTSAAAQGPTFTLTVTGGSFVPCSVVQWNGVSLATTYVSSTALTATVPATDIFNTATTPQTINVTVFTIAPPAGGSTSAPATFTVGPAPTP